MPCNVLILYIMTNITHANIIVSVIMLMFILELTTIFDITNSIIMLVQHCMVLVITIACTVPSNITHYF